MLVNSGAMDTLVLVVVEETSAYSSCYVKTKKHWYIAHMQQHFYVIALFFWCDSLSAGKQKPYWVVFCQILNSVIVVKKFGK